MVVAMECLGSRAYPLEVAAPVVALVVAAALLCDAQRG